MDRGLQGVECQLKADLVVALTCAAVGDGEAALLLRDSDLGAGDDWAGEGCAEEVDVLVDGIAGDRWVAELFNELRRKSVSGHGHVLNRIVTYLSAKVLNVALAGANLERLLLGCLEVLLLANIGHEGNYLIVLVLVVVSMANTMY